MAGRRFVPYAAATLLALLAAAMGNPSPPPPPEEMIWGGRDGLDMDDKTAFHGQGDYTNAYADDRHAYTEEIIGNAPYGSFLEEDDMQCPGTGKRVNRYFYGSSIALNSAMATDPFNNECDTSSEIGEDAVGGFLKYFWTTWPAGHPQEGGRCEEQFDADGNSLGKIVQTSGRATDPDTGETLNSLWVCKVTYSWEEYENVRYAYGDASTGRLAHPWPGNFVKPGNIVKNNLGWLYGNQILRTWGCDWLHVSPALCKDASGDVTTDNCNPTCYKDFGCGYGETPEFKQLLLKEMVVEVELNPHHSHPPDLYLYKPQILSPDGFPAGSPHTPSEFFKNSEIELRVSQFMSPYLPVQLKQNPAFGAPMDEETGDVILALSTDNFGQQDFSKSESMYVLFDDHALTPIHTVHDWTTGVYAPEDRLDAFRNRGSSGGGTWVLITVDDCDAQTGNGAEVVNWQIHFVCMEIGFCKQNASSPPPPPSPPPPSESPPPPPLKDASGSGDPHMVGFRGQTFDYHGAPGEFFNVLSTPRTQLNAFLQPELLDGLTYMGSIGLQLSTGERLQVTAVPDTHSLLVELGDVAVAEDAATGAIAVRFPDATTVEVVTPELALVAVLHKEEFIDVRTVELRSDPGTIHGVLGNTANLPQEVDLEGDEEDYFVSSMWATDFKHNVFMTGAEPERPLVKRLRPLVHDVSEAFARAEVMAARMVNIVRK